MLKAENKPDYALKIKVIPGGCSGYSYDLAFVKSPTSDIDPRIRAAFQRNFLKVEDIKELPSVLRRAYLDLSFM